MASKVFLDSNILLDYFLKRDRYEQTKLLFEHILNGRFRAYISSSIVHITAHWLTKFHGSQKAKEILRTLLYDVVALEMTHDVAVLALESVMGDLEDALQYHTALYHKADVFISQDKQLKKSALAALPL